MMNKPLNSAKKTLNSGTGLPLLSQSLFKSLCRFRWWIGLHLASVLFGAGAFGLLWPPAPSLAYHFNHVMPAIEYWIVLIHEDGSVQVVSLTEDEYYAFSPGASTVALEAVHYSVHHHQIFAGLMNKPLDLWRHQVEIVASAGTPQEDSMAIEEWLESQESVVNEAIQNSGFGQLFENCKTGRYTFTSYRLAVGYILIFLSTLFQLVVAIFGLYILTLLHLHSMRANAGRCSMCDYPLSEGWCSECGDKN